MHVKFGARYEVREPGLAIRTILPVSTISKAKQRLSVNAIRLTPGDIFVANGVGGGFAGDGGTYPIVTFDGELAVLANTSGTFVKDGVLDPIGGPVSCIERQPSPPAKRGSARAR